VRKGGRCSARRSVSGLDVASACREHRVVGQRLVGLELQITFDREPERATHGFQLRDRDIAELGTAEPQVTQAEGDVGIFRMEFRQEPDGIRIRREQLHDRERVMSDAAGGYDAR
jgi:hypothetical protein